MNTTKSGFLPPSDAKDETAVLHVLDKRTNKDTDEYAKRVHNSLGLFLAQYLCNGFNLTDEGYKGIYKWTGK